MHPADFRDQVLSQLSRRHLNHSANWFNQTLPFSFSLLRAHIASQHGWVSRGEDLISLALFFLTTIFRSCWIQHFPLWLCWHPWTGTLRADGLQGPRQPECGLLMLRRGKGEKFCLHSCSCGQLMFLSLERSKPPKRSVRKWAALCRAQPSSVPTQHCCPGEPLHSFGPPCPATARMKPHTNKTNPFLWWGQ